jgi:hypothetical protein
LAAQKVDGEIRWAMMTVIADSMGWMPTGIQPSTKTQN